MQANIEKHTDSTFIFSKEATPSASATKPSDDSQKKPSDGTPMFNGGGQSDDIFSPKAMGV